MPNRAREPPRYVRTTDEAAWILAHQVLAPALPANFPLDITYEITAFSIRSPNCALFDDYIWPSVVDGKARHVVMHFPKRLAPDVLHLVNWKQPNEYAGICAELSSVHFTIRRLSVDTLDWDELVLKTREQIHDSARKLFPFAFAARIVFRDELAATIFPLPLHSECFWSRPNSVAIELFLSSLQARTLSEFI